MIAPVHRLKKAEIISLANGRCRHGHTYLEHYQCYLDEHKNEEEKVGFLDIETSNLDANFGVILTWAINSNGIITNDRLSKEDIERYDSDKIDTRIVKNLVEELFKYDRIVTYYGKRFDIPFLRTRALYDNIDFPVYGSLKHDDVYFWVKYKLKLNSNRMEVAARTIFGETDKTHIEFKYWIAGTRGDEEALSYILDHNIKDVEELERVYYKLVDFARRQDSSI